MTAPVASFTYTWLVGPAMPASIQFTDTSTNSPNTWLWDFGDGWTSASQSPIHNYIRPGTYVVSLKATNGDGNSTYRYPTAIVITNPTINQHILIGGIDVSDQYQTSTMSTKDILMTRPECDFTLHNTGSYRPQWGQEVGVYDMTRKTNRTPFSVHHAFNGTTSYMVSTSNITIGTASAASGGIHIWFKRLRTSSTECLLKLSNNNYSIGVMLQSNGTIQVTYAGATGMVGTTQTAAFACGVGIHEVIFTWDNTSGSYFLWLDGTYLETVSSGCTFKGGSYQTYVGQSGSTTQFFQGNVYELEIVARVLTTIDATRCYHGEIINPYDDGMAACFFVGGSSYTGVSPNWTSCGSGGWTPKPSLTFNNIVSTEPAENIWPDKKFGGTIYEVKEYSNNLAGQNWFDIKCVGFAELLDRMVVAYGLSEGGSWGVTDIAWKVQGDFFGREGVYFANDPGPNPTMYTFSEDYKNGATVMDDLAKAGNRIWWVDGYRGLWFVPATYLPAPWTISDSSNNFRNFSVMRSKSDYINSEFLKTKVVTDHDEQASSVYFANLKSTTAGCSCGSVCWTLRPVVTYYPVWNANGGTTTTPPTSGGTFLKIQEYSEYNRSKPCDVVWKYGTNWINLAWATNIPGTTTPMGTFKLIDGSGLFIDWDYNWEEVYYSEVATEIASLKALDFLSSGRYSRTIENTEMVGGAKTVGGVVTVPAYDSINADLAILANKSEIIEFDTYFSGLKVGQFMNVTMNQFDCSDTYLIVEVSITEIDNMLYSTHVKAQGERFLTNWVYLFKRMTGLAGNSSGATTTGGGGGSGGGGGTDFTDTTTSSDSMSHT